MRLRSMMPHGAGGFGSAAYAEHAKSREQSGRGESEYAIQYPLFTHFFVRGAEHVVTTEVTNGGGGNRFLGETDANGHHALNTLPSPFDAESSGLHGTREANRRQGKQANSPPEFPPRTAALHAAKGRGLGAPFPRPRRVDNCKPAELYVVRCAAAVDHPLLASTTFILDTRSVDDSLLSLRKR